ncbi:MAG: hypothetical protein MJ137_06845 [Clostridia bacterium]|nr:hypothetical protein [Clostridia bacterium]
MKMIMLVSTGPRGGGNIGIITHTAEKSTPGSVRHAEPSVISGKDHEL